MSASTCHAFTYSQVPHAIQMDSRLKTAHHGLVGLLVRLSYGNPTLTVSDRTISEASGESVATVRRWMAHLLKIGHTRHERVPKTIHNMTGRVIHLRWIEDPSYLASVPQRECSSPAPVGRPRILKVQSPVSEPSGVTTSETGKGPVTSERTVQSPVSGQSSHQRLTKNKTEESKEQQAEPPALKVVEAPELTPEGLQAIEAIQKAVDASDRPQASQGVVAVAEAAIRKGHGPGRVVELAKESLKPEILSPAGWLRRAVENRAADERRPGETVALLRDRPKPPPPPTLPISTVTEEERLFHATASYGHAIGPKAKRRARGVAL